MRVMMAFGAPGWIMYWFHQLCVKLGCAYACTKTIVTFIVSVELCGMAQSYSFLDTEISILTTVLISTDVISCTNPNCSEHHNL